MDEARAVASQFLFAEPVIWLQGVGRGSPLGSDQRLCHSSENACFPAKAGIQTGLPPSRENQAGEGRRQPNTTPAKAGAQLGDGANCAQSFVTAAFPTGPRPPPGWRYCGVGG